MKPTPIPPASAVFRGAPLVGARQPAVMRGGGPLPAPTRSQPAYRPGAFSPPAGTGRVNRAVPARIGPAAAAPHRPGARPANRPALPAAMQAPRVASAGVARAPEFSLQTPTRIAGGHQRINMTLKGTQHVVGSVEVSAASKGTVHISNLRVEKQFRRQGVAGQLMNAAFSNARTHGYSGVKLEAKPSDSGMSRQALVSMYQRMGFKSTGTSSRGGQLMERHL